MITVKRLSEKVRKRFEQEELEEAFRSIREHVERQKRAEKEDKTWHFKIDTLVFGFVLVFIIWASIITGH